MHNYIIKLNIPAGRANATPPIGPILGQYKLNLIEFCKDFNEQTILFNDSIILPVKLYVQNDGEFEYIIKKPNTNFLLKKIIDENEINDQSRTITIYQLYELIYIKWLNINNMNKQNKLKHLNILLGSIKSMQNINIIY